MCNYLYAIGLKVLFNLLFMNKNLREEVENKVLLSSLFSRLRF